MTFIFNLEHEQVKHITKEHKKVSTFLKSGE